MLHQGITHSASFTRQGLHEALVDFVEVGPYSFDMLRHFNVGPEKRLEYGSSLRFPWI